MRLRAKPVSSLKNLDGALVLGIFKGDNLPGWIAELSGNSTLAVSAAMDEDDFSGDWKQTLLLRMPDGEKLRRVLVVGLGEPADFTVDRARRAAGTAAGELSNAGQKTVAMAAFPPGELGKALVYVKAQIEGFMLASYKFDIYKSKDNKNKKTEIKFLDAVNPEGSAGASWKKTVAEAEATIHGVYLARDLASQPGNVATPTYLAAQARKIGRMSKKIRVSVFNRSKIKELGMGGLLGVSQGSTQPPRFIVLEYKGGRAKSKPVALVGKGITFDSGGISIKPAAKMEEMKYDMCGAAAVLGTFRALVELNVKRNVVGFIPTTENLPGGTALKPGDVIRTFSGKTIEVFNTDAEGRLILADALAYAVKNYKPAAIIDLATLTGAVVVALGAHATGMMANNSDLSDAFKAAGETTGERVWELPLWEEYHEQIKSDIADMKNLGGRDGGSITAAALLEKFVGETPWVHLDIAGTAYLEKPLPYVPKGHSGVGVRLLLEYLNENG